MTRGGKWVTWLGLAALLGAPTPGAVGSCGGDDLGQPVDFESYCVEREDLVCVRQWERREITERQRDECRRTARDMCAQRSWLPDCRPTEREARACLNALRSRETLAIPEDEIDECGTDALCGARPQPMPPRSIGDGSVGATER